MSLVTTRLLNEGEFAYHICHYAGTRYSVLALSRMYRYYNELDGDVDIDDIHPWDEFKEYHSEQELWNEWRVSMDDVRENVSSFERLPNGHILIRI